MVIFVAVWKINYAPSSADAEAPSEWIKLEGAVMKTVYEMFPFALPRGFRLLRNNQQQKVNKTQDKQQMFCGIQNLAVKS